MYKFLLCLRYLRTRYLAFVCIVSIMLGVATLIVVNSVMSGFSNKLKNRLHGTSADLIIDSDFVSGLEEHPDALTRRILASPPGQYIESVAPSVQTGGMIQFNVRGRNIVKMVQVMGVDPARQSTVGDFDKYIVGQKGRNVSFDLTPQAEQRLESVRQREAAMQLSAPRKAEQPGTGGDFLGSGPQAAPSEAPPPAIPMPDMPTLEPIKPIGIIVGYSIAHFSYKDPATGQPVERKALEIGDILTLATYSADDMRPVWNTYVVVDYFKSEMSEYDSQFVYLPLPEMQRLRHMGPRVTHLQMKLKASTPKDYSFVKPNVAVAQHNALGGIDSGLRVVTWEDTQGPLLSAIDIERGILNLLLFMIVGVAGFSILAIFTMIVSEKVRDIGILKSLGASNRGVMGIFVWYAIFLGVVGCSLGSLAGIGITNNINEIESWINGLTGQQLFDRSVYYFDRIPTNIESLTVSLVNFGAMTVAVFSSLIPAMRAARLRPIQALRFE